MIPIYQRYIITSILIPFIIVSFVTTTIIWITQILHFLYLIDHGIKFTDFLSLIILILPSILFIILPFAALFALIYSYNNLIIEKQLIILKQSGLSNSHLAYPVLLFTIFIVIIAYYFALHLMPVTYKTLKHEMNILKNTYSTNIINEKEFTKIARDMVIYTTGKSKNNLLKGIVLFDNRDQQKQIIFFAKKGRVKMVHDHLMLELSEGMRQSYDGNNNLTKLYFANLIVELDNLTAMNEDNLYRRHVREYFLNELLFPANEYDKSKKNRLIVEGHQRIIWPLYITILPILAVSLLLRAPYNKNGNFKTILLIISMVTVIIYIHFTCQNLATGNLNFIYASYINLLVTALLGVYFLTSQNKTTKK